MKRKRLQTRYRHLPALSDIAGMKSAVGEMRGIGHPKQPRLNKEAGPGKQHKFDEDWFIAALAEKIKNHPDNTFDFPFYGEAMYEAPLVGFARGDDPIFEEYKQIIGPHHFTPAEIMAWQAEKNGVEAPVAVDLSVISFILPFQENTKKDNARQKDWTAERWAQTRLLGELFSQTMVREITTELMDNGILAVSPDVTPMFRKKRYPDVGWASPWSHRHMAYAAGLGTFGLHDFFITEKGAAHRLGSFVVHRSLKPDKKRPDDIHAYCLHYQGKKCRACERKCPVGAISPEGGHDKEACYKRVADSTKYCIKNYHTFIYGCGLCSTGVPCESGIPKGIEK